LPSNDTEEVCIVKSFSCLMIGLLMLFTGAVAHATPSTWTLQNVTSVVIVNNGVGFTTYGDTAGTVMGSFVVDYSPSLGGGPQVLDWSITVQGVAGGNEGTGWTGPLAGYTFTPSNSSSQVEAISGDGIPDFGFGNSSYSLWIDPSSPLDGSTSTIPLIWHSSAWIPASTYNVAGVGAAPLEGYLNETTVPVPSALFLFGPGLIALSEARRRLGK
jgi:hypothetical protein